MRVQIHTQLRRALNYVFPIHSARKRLVLHLLPHARDFHVGNRLASASPAHTPLGSPPAHRRQTATYPDASPAARPSTAHAPGSPSASPAASPAAPARARPQTDAPPASDAARSRSRAAGRWSIELATGRALISRQSQPVRLCLAARRHANLHRQRMFAQAFALRPLGQQLPRLLAPECSHSPSAVPAFFSPMLHTLVRVSSGFSGYDGAVLGLTLSFYLTIMVHSSESSTYRGAKKHPGEPALALRTQTMATTLVSVEDTRSRALRSLQPRAIQNQQLHLQTMPQAPGNRGACATGPAISGGRTGPARRRGRVAGRRQVREIRRARHLSQRQLASRMQVPRTYISKIENGKAIPTLGSLERLARPWKWTSASWSATLAAAATRKWRLYSPIRCWPRLRLCFRISTPAPDADLRLGARYGHGPPPHSLSAFTVSVVETPRRITSAGGVPFPCLVPSANSVQLQPLLRVC